VLHRTGFKTLVGRGFTPRQAGREDPPYVFETGSSARTRVGWWLLAAIAVLTASAAAVVVRAQDNAAPLEVLQIRPNFYMIVGAGANIGAQVGPNGVVVVNAGTAGASSEVVAAIKKLTSQPIRYIIDTSADPDVVGGNANIAKAGRNITSFATGSGSRTTIAGTDADAARILAHENVLTRMSEPPGASPFQSDLWPTETFFERRRTMYFNDEGIEIIHVPAAHTDGDTVVFFRKSDVVVVGNLIDTDRFPVIDLAKGGSLQGEIDALNRIIEIAIPPGPFVGLPSGPNATDTLQGGTDIVPGRGRIYREIDVVNYRDMLVIIRDIVQDMIERKMTLEQIKAADPAKPYRARYGAVSGPWTTDDFLEAVYKSLTNPKS
jgi:glyoxylase-like metal-dependent hydrolase (beta-lactamase superfamily II)